MGSGLGFHLWKNPKSLLYCCFGIVLDNSILEGNSKIIINALKNGDMFNSAYGLGNAIADALARRAKFSFPLSIWLESVPPDMVNFVNANLPVSWIIHPDGLFLKKIYININKYHLTQCKFEF